MGIERGQYVLLYHSENAKYLVSFIPNKALHTHLGIVELREDLEFGDVIKSSKGKLFYVLRPSTSDISMKVRRTTTIIYPKDAGWMILEAGVGAGSKVIEVGTGSGALTIILAKIVGPNGKVYSFERRPEFLENAKQNVEKAGLAEIVHFELRDPAVDGFGVKDADAIFVDVPEPWTLAQAAHDALAGGAAWVSLSPQIEQVKSTFEALRGAGFVRLKCVEILEREMLVRDVGTRPKERMVSHTGYLVSARKVKNA
ncbi:MAG: tRNA methyltransferase [Candidatus Hydrothermota bacterium]|nr:MAG: tRNA methyltransferase [Candidatus Hydrothermae bacterium]